MTSNRPRIVCDSAIVGAAELLGHFCDLVQVPGTAIDSQALAGADGLIVRTVTRVGEELLRGTSVKVVATATAGTDHLDLSWLASQGITFGDAAGANAQAVAQFVATIVVQRWASLASEMPPVVGIVGFGHVGRSLAQILTALAIPHQVCDPLLRDAGYLPAQLHCELDALVDACDIITLHVPLTKTGSYPTYHLFKGLRLAAFIGRNGLLINTARGSVVPAHAWVDQASSLPANCLAFDVWDNEPQLPWQQVAAPCLLFATPHVAGYSACAKLNASRMAAEVVLRRLIGPEVELPELATPPSKLRPIALQGRETALQALASVLLQLGTIASDTIALRALAQDLEPSLRPRKFELLRSGYPLREQWSQQRVDLASFDVLAADQRDLLVESLRSLAIRIESTRR